MCLELIEITQFCLKIYDLWKLHLLGGDVTSHSVFIF